MKDYYRMAETGVLPPHARVELLNGEIIDMSPIGPFHGGLVNRLVRIFTEHSKSRWLVSAQNPLHLGNDSEPQPDVMLLKIAPDDYASNHPRPDDVFLLVEVSDSTVESDQSEKIPAYGRAGVAEVWIVNLNELTVEVYREAHFTGYGSKMILRPGEQAAPLAFPDAAVDVAELLRR